MARVYIKSYGCSASMNDAEIMKGLLGEAGFLLVDDERVADVIILNTCVVKGATQAKILKELTRIANAYPFKKLIVAGCLPFSGIEIPIKSPLLGPHAVRRIVPVVQMTMSGETVTERGDYGEPKLGLPKVSESSVVNIVQILEGCSGDCAYCIVKRVKPVLRSYPLPLIVKEVAKGFDAGAKEVWLTSQDNAAYGLDLQEGRMLPELLRQVCAVQGEFRVRLGMSNPDNVLPILDELVDAFRSQKMFKFLHIPVQSGNDAVLKMMNRRYGVDDFRRIVSAFRETFPDISVSTDIICGFPGESEAQFADSMRLVKDIQPDVLNISRFTAQPGTVAAGMEHQIHGNISKVRSVALSKVFSEISTARNKRWLSWTGRILVDEVGKKGTMVGRNDWYRPVVVNGSRELLGMVLTVKIVEAKRHYLVGEILEH